MRFPRFRTLIYSFLVFLVLFWAGVFILLQSDAFWQWAGPRVVQMVNARLQGNLTVGKIKGNPFSGYAFQDLELTSKGSKIFQARELQLRISFFSLLDLRPSISLTLDQPSLNLKKDQQGHWNVTQILRPSKTSGEIWLPISALHLQPLLIKDADITLQQPQGNQRIQHLNLNLAVTLLEPLTDRQRLDVKKLALGADTPWGPYSLAGSLTVSAKRLQIASLVLKSGESHLLSLKGMVPFLSKTQKLQVTGMLGPIPGAVFARFLKKWPPAWVASGKLQVTGPRSQVGVNFKGKVYQAAFSLTGRISQIQKTWNYDLALALNDVPPEMLAAFDPAQAKELQAATPLSARLHLKGEGLSWPPRQFAWDLQLKPLTYRQIKLEQCQVSISGTDREQKLSGAVKGNFGRVELKAQGSFLQSPKGQVTLEVAEFQPGLFGLGMPEGSLLTGKFSGQVAVPDPAQPQRFSVSGEVQATGRIGEHPLKELRARFAWAKPRLNLQQFRAQVGNLRTELQGVLDGDQLNFTLRGRTMPGGSWPVPAALGGSLVYEGRVTGRLAAPAYSLQLTGRSLSWEKYDLKSLTLRARGQGLPPREGTLDVKAQGLNTPAGAFARVNFSARGGGSQWQFTLKAASPPKGPHIEMAGTGDFSSRPMSLAVQRLLVHLQGITAKNKGTVQVRFLPGFTLAPATLLVNGGTVTAEADLQNSQISALLTVRDLPLSLTRVKGLEGKIQARLSLEGPAPGPQMDGEISLVSVKWQEFAVQSMKTSFSYSPTSLTFSGGLQESKKGGRINWEGRLPLRFSLQPFHFALPDEEMDLKLRAQGANLAMLTILTPEVQKAKAPLDLQAEVTGRLVQPRITGELRWGAGRIKLRQAGAPYHLQPGYLRWQNGRISLPQLTFKKEGTAVFSGDVTLAGFKPQRVKARAQFNNFQVLNKLGSEAYLQGLVNLTGPWSALVLAGRLTIPRASLNPAILKQNGTSLPTDYVLVGAAGAKAKKKEKTLEPDPYRRMAIRVTLEANKDVAVRDKMANIELALDIRINKRPGGPLLVGGVIRSLQGKIDVYGKEFILERGLVTLPGVPDQEPYLQARAVHQMTDATFIVNVSGPVNKPKIDLSSSPAMPPNDLLSYLLFDRPASSLSKQEFDVTQQAVGVLGGITARKIQDLLGSDFPILGNVSLGGSQGAIGVTKPLTKGVTLSVERKLNPAQGDNPVQLRLEYKINRHLSLEAEGGQSRTGADALFNYEW